MADPREARLASARVYQCAAGVTWAVEKDGIVLVHPDTRAVCTLGYPEAAVWDLISRGYSYRQTVAAVCAIGALTPAAAERLVHEHVTGWAEAGFLREVEHG